MRKYLSLVLCISMLLILTSCGNDSPEVSLEILNNIGSTKVEYETVTVKRGDLLELLEVVDVYATPIVTKAFSYEEDVVVKAVHFKGYDVIKAGELILELDTQEIDDEIMYQKFDIEMEEILLNDLKSSGSNSNAIRIKELDIEILTLELKEMEKERENLNIYAETECYISNRAPTVGTKYLANDIIVVLVNNIEFDLETSRELNLDQYKNVQIGDPVTLTILDKTFKAEVSFITANDKNFGRIHFQALEDVSFSGKSVYNTRISAEFEPVIAKDVLYIPTIVLKNNMKDYVELYKGDIKRIRYVKCGVDGFDENDRPITQIIGGLKEGETVIVKKKSIVVD